MKVYIRWMTSIAAAILIMVMAFSFAACGGDDSVVSEGPTAGSGGTLADGDDDKADEHGADTDADAFAYLEAAPKDQLYLVEMTNFAFTPNTLEVGAGEVLEIAIQNVERVLHDFTIDEIDADVHVSYLAGTGQHGHAESLLKTDVHFALTEPGSGVVHIKVHEPGEYVIYCSVPGHREAGMEGTLIVR